MPPSPEHLSLIEGIVSRMAHNSFLIRGWSVTLAAALIGFAASGSDRSLAWIAIGAVAVFALLDARYLALERRYVELYERVAAANATDWSLRVEPVGVGDAARAICSWAVALPHGAALGASLAVALIG